MALAWFRLAWHGLGGCAVALVAGMIGLTLACPYMYLSMANLAMIMDGPGWPSRRAPVP